MNKRFRVAFSFAGEQRPFVAEVAGLLAERFGQDGILYDKYHEAEFARSDLAFHLPSLYHHQADLVVAVLCPDYHTKEWCGLEWSAIYGVLKQRQVDQVMLCRFEHCEGQGLYGLAGFVELDRKTAAEVTTLIFERLALNEGHPRDHYTRPASTGPDWPVVAPTLDWPIADHTQARDAFAQLITRAAPFRYLPISGQSETGKSHLTKQFLGNAHRISDLTCARFDCKGSTNMEAELCSFAERLDVSIPSGLAGVSHILAHIFASLKKLGRPTLLIFDTFELAGEADRWVRETLLLALMRAPWLRLIVVGQRVPGKHGESWSAVSAEPIELRLPSPQEWFDYGQLHRPHLTLEFVHTAHEFCRGKVIVLAQLLGPTA